MESLRKLLCNYSTDKYFIEYMGYRSNHLAQGAIALFRIGASEHKTQSFIDQYTARLESAESHKTQESENKPNYFLSPGQQRCFYHMLRYYEDKLEHQCNSSIKQLLEAEYPKLSLGIAGAAFHGLIQLGYGVSVGCERIVCEGLAYIRYAHLSPEGNVSLTFDNQGNLDAVDVLNQIRLDEGLMESMLIGAREIAAKDPRHGAFRRRMGGLFDKKFNELVAYADLLSIPETALNDSNSLANYVVKLSIIVFAASVRQNDFFLLHGVTSAWSLKQVINQLDDEKAAQKASKMFLVCLLATYVIQECPELDINLTNHKNLASFDWTQIIRETIATERDAHIYKVVQVCFDMTREDRANENLYRSAALIALNNQLHFVNYQT